MQASRRDISSAVGRMVFGGQSTKKGIARQLRAVDSDKLKDAMQRHGLGGESMEKVAKVLSGKDRAGWSAAKMKKAVQALQDVHVASAHQGASKMVLTASKNAQERRILSPEEKKKYFQQLARERRTEANQEAEQVMEGSSMSILDRMRGAAGRANKTSASGTASTVNGGREDIRGLREEMREQMKLAPKLVIPKPSEDTDSAPGFQV